ncbi:MAG: polysaccharide deacetylase family protein [Lachnospiraceae bacterium]|nr:polysaccharide deacetylase family protein [Lachnospiraceae bacterium]
MSERKIWQGIRKRFKKLHFWGKCLVFDLCCICVVLGMTVLGVGNGEKMRRGVAAFWIQEDIRSASVDGVQGDTGEEEPQDTVLQEQSEKKKIALTFDDGPHPQYTPKMLAVLKEKNVKATFFLLGEEVEKYPEIVKQIHEQGHVIGNHSYKHEQLSKLSLKQACERVDHTNRLIYDLTGVYPSYLRPPFGDWHEKLDCEANMLEVLWDVDTLDWSSQNHAQIVNKVLNNVQENDIILMHDGYETSVTAAAELIDTLTKQGYDFVTVDEILFD